MTESKSTSPAIIVTRTVPSSVQALFDAWTKPELVERWGPQRASIDAQVGGEFRFETDGVEGTFDIHVVKGKYKEIVAAKKIVQTWIYQGPLSLDEEIETLVTVEFKEKARGLSEIIVKEEGEPLKEPDAKKSAREAWEAALDNLSIVCVS